ncbi:MAG: NnrS family protein [Magnetospirillum gryphiswaldense]|nr:NnrS family protein [Magnetospirillum gryphiswaldense]
MFAGAFMMGAKDRLLPPVIPFRFFASAVLFHVVGWAVLAWGAQDVPGFLGGGGAVVAALHLVTLGVLAMTAMGAAYQMLPVATRRQLGPAWACSLSWWLFNPGIVALALGLGTGWSLVLEVGAGLCVAALALFGLLVARNLARVDDLPAVTWPAWVAMASLAAVLVLAVVLVADMDAGLLTDRPALAATHALLAGYGFMGMLVVGFSAVLVPMFVLSKPVDDAQGKKVAAVAALALLAAVSGTLGRVVWLQALGCVLGLGAVGLYVVMQRRVLASRMRKKLEPFFRLLKAGWALQVLSLAAVLALALGAPADRLAPLWGWLLVFGWLLSFATGILQRIMPFLASMHSGAKGGKPVLLSHLTHQRLLDLHAAAHGAALALMMAAIVLDQPLLARLAAVSGLAGALAFGGFAAVLMTRYRAHERSS